MHILGIDIGISSVGFGLLEMDEKGASKDGKILCCNAHLFPAAEQPDKKSLAEPRRSARLARRRLARRHNRMHALRYILRQHGFRDLGIYDEKKPAKERALVEPWQIRVDALGKQLSEGDFATALGHLCKNRGFRSNAKAQEKVIKEEAHEQGADEEKKEAKAMLDAIEQRHKKLKNTDLYRTFGEWVNAQPKKRNSQGDYFHTPCRKRDILPELEKIITEQRNYQNPLANNKLYEQIKTLIWEQRPIKGIAKMVGDCSFFPKQKRAAKNAPSAEYFVAWSRLNNLQIQGDNYGEEWGIPTDVVSQLIEAALEKSTGELTFTQARKILKMEERERYNFLTYKPKKKKPKKDGTVETEQVESMEAIIKRLESKPLISFRGTVTLQRIISKHNPDLWTTLFEQKEDLDKMAQILAFEKDDQKRQKQLRELSCFKNTDEHSALVDELVEAVDFTKTIDISAEACRRIVPHMAKGVDYDTAWRTAGLTIAQDTQKKTTDNRLPCFPTTANPVVNRALAQTRKVLHAVFRVYGMPDRIHVELARELDKSAKKRDERRRENLVNEEHNLALKKEAEGIFKMELSETDPRIYKYRLWKEQKHYCLYAQRLIKPEELKDNTATQVDHALPMGRTSDNNHSNKVLCLTKENQDKGDQTPYEYLKGNGKWMTFQELVRTSNMPENKKTKITAIKINEEDFKNRNLNDTRYMARELKTHLTSYLPKREDGKMRVQVRNGSLTSLLRRRWGLNMGKDDKKNRDDARHHAMDALIIAASTQAMVQKVARWNRLTGQVKGDPNYYPPKPWLTFREDAIKAYNDVFVSRQPQRKHRGKIHDDTIKAIRTSKSGEPYTVERRPLSKVKKKDLKNIEGVKINEQGKAQGRNAWLYNLLYQHLDKHGDDPNKAFAEPLYLKKKDSSQGPQIRSLRLRTDEKSWFNIRGGAAQNATMVRVDVFKGQDGYYLCPLYMADVARGKLPDQLMTVGKPEKDWLPINDSHQFLFSLYSHDFVRLTQKDGTVQEGYYCGTDRTNAQIYIFEHTKSVKFYHNFGVKTCQSIQKFYVDYFGTRHEIKQEKRLDVARRQH